MKEPTRFEFFRVPANWFQEGLTHLQHAFSNPDTAENRAFIEMHRVHPQDYIGQSRQQAPLSSHPLIHEDNAPWSQLETIGITRETLEQTGNLDRLLNWQRTDLLPITTRQGDISVRTDARLALRENADGNLSVAVHALRREPELDRAYFGVRFSEEDKRNMLTTGNLGHIAEAEFK